ncbi:hypothetical protein PsorP6_013651 [Peronosclerospora sorghi]|uniref:Uncharacterized protein n=1 Tax=Peronosclerospora sorghi TaxID=230839 RepID=A0ACC0VHW3_9STRA|nr:hypothetical protein PsorP6_013651 [Peronosclerospora sorghi]
MELFCFPPQQKKSTPTKIPVEMSSTPTNDEDFVIKTTKHRKKQQQVSSVAEVVKKPPTVTSSGAANGSAATSSNNTSNISLRPRTMFAMKGRGRTESEGSAYRPQWSKDGEGFLSSTSGSCSTSSKDAATGGGEDHRVDRRKNKVLRYSKEELLALHFTTTELPMFPAETTVVSEHSLPPVSTLPFDYEEIYKQWSLNRNRVRGRGRGNTPSGGGIRGHQERGARGDETEGLKQHKDENQRCCGKELNWTRGAKVTDGYVDDVWDNVLDADPNSNEMDLLSMAEAAEKFRQEMDAMRKELQEPKKDPDEMKDNLDAFDKKLEDAAAAGQFDDSDDEAALWDDHTPEIMQNTNTADGPLQSDTTEVVESQPGGRQLFNARESGEEQLLPERSNFSQSQKLADKVFDGPSSLRFEVEDEWFYLDPQGLQQGPFKTAEMREWFEAGYFKPHLPIRFGQEGIFTALANHFAHGQIPFASPPTRTSSFTETNVEPLHGDRQHLLELQHEQQRQQQQQMMQLQQQQLQQQQRMLQLNQEEKIRLEMQRLELARQQHQTQLFQQQQILQRQQEQQQQQQMLLQQQNSWQRNQREGIMSALGIFEKQDRNDNFRTDGLQVQFQSDYRLQHQMNVQNTQLQAQDSIFSNDQDQCRDQALWSNTVGKISGIDNITRSLDELQQIHAASSIKPKVKQPKSPEPDSVQEAWGSRLISPQHLSSALYDVQNGEKRHAAPETENTRQTSFQHKHPKSVSLAKSSTQNSIGEGSKKISSSMKNGKNADSVESKAHAWAVKPTSALSKAVSLKEIQQQEHRDILNKMSDDKGNTANLAQMGAQLKMMLGVNSTTTTSNTSSVPVLPTQTANQMSRPMPLPTSTLISARTQNPPSSVTSPWGTPASVSKASNSKSMRDILAEEERLAQERIKASEKAPTTSHWMNVVAGNKVAAAAIPKLSRSVLGPVPASVLKSRQQIRSTHGAPKPSPQKNESDASFWNFGAAQSSDKQRDAQVGSSNAFGSNNVSSQFMTWALKQIKSIDGNANVTLLEYCASLEDPGEIREYLAAYLGSTPRVSAFATDFIQRKKTQHSGKKY